MLKVLFLIVALAPASALASDYRGIMSLGSSSSKFPCGDLLNILESAPRPAMAILPRIFGDNLNCVKRFMSRFADRKHAVVIYGEDNTGRRNRKQYSGAWLRGETVQGLNRRLERNDRGTLNSFTRHTNAFLRSIVAGANHNTRLVLVPSLEDNFSSRAWRNLSRHVRQNWPYQIARNSVNDANRYIAETEGVDRHTTQRADCLPGKLCVASNDGTYLSASRIQAYFNRQRAAHIAMFWHPECSNGRKRINDTKFTFSEPRSRSFDCRGEWVTPLREALQ